MTTNNATLNADVRCFAATEGQEKPYDFELVGYTGKIMSQMGMNFIFDMDGIESKDGGVIVLREHERDRIVGHGEVSKDERGLVVRGKFSKATKDGKEIKAILDEGIVPLQCSVGIAPESVKPGEDGMMVNGFSIDDRVQVWDKSYVGEVSICSWGVDTDTSVHSFAKEITMEDIKKEEVEVKEEEKEVCEKCGNDTCECEGDHAEETKEEAPEAADKAEAGDDKEEKKFSAADLEAAVAAERSRVAGILDAGAPVELAHKAISDGLSEGEAYKFFWQSEKGKKDTGLAEMAASAEIVEKVVEDKKDAEPGYTELIELAKAEGKSHMDAMAHVMKNHPEAYAKFIEG